MHARNTTSSNYRVKSADDNAASFPAAEFSNVLKNHYHADTFDVSSIERLNEGGSKAIYKVSLRPECGANFEYAPGDSISLICPNADNDVSWLLDRTDLEGHSPDQPLLIERERPDKSASGLPLNVCLSPRLLIKHCLELHSPASRRTLNLLANHFTSDTCSTSRLQRTLIHQLVAREGAPLYNRWIRDSNMTVMDLLATFDACRPTVAALLDLFPFLRPRAYSLVDEGTGCAGDGCQELVFVYTRVDFCVTEDLGTVEGVTFRRYQRRHGTCTGWLDDLRKNLTKRLPMPPLLLRLRDNLNNFRHPPVDITSKENAPLILIAAGTGLAPFISFLQYRRRQAHKGAGFQPTWLLFGCRDSHFDLLFPTTLLDFLRDGTLGHLCLCFSRRPFQTDSAVNPPLAPHLRDLLGHACLPQKCKYVQECMLAADCRIAASGAGECPADVATAFADLSMQESSRSHPPPSHADQLTHLVMDCGAHIRVCGDAKGMAPAVASAWVALFALRLATGGVCIDPSKVQTLTPEEIKRGQSYLAMLKQKRRYIEDVWR